MFEPQTLILGEACLSGIAFEANKCEKVIRNNKSIIAASKNVGFGKDIDISWLPAASDTYHISSDIRDFILVPVPLVTSDVPNRNLQAFSLDELSYFDPFLGTLTFKSFIGKPTFVDHINSNPVEAKGVNLDVSMVYIKKYDIWKVNVLGAFDRTKDRDLCLSILNRDRRGYSMGSMVSEFECSICSNRSKKQNSTDCEHMALGKGTVIDGKLVYELCRGVNFIENSNLSGNDPADVTAWGDDAMLY